MHAEQASIILLDRLLENDLVSFGVPADLQHIVDVVYEALTAGRTRLQRRDHAQEDDQWQIESEEGVEGEKCEEVEEALEANEYSYRHLPLVLAEDRRHIRKTLRVFIHQL